MTEKPIHFKPISKVEQLQAEAATSVCKRAAFYEALLNSELYVLSEVSENNEEAVLHTWQGGTEDVCGVFTSLEKLTEAMPPGTPYIRVSARVIFEVMAHESLGVLVNPRYEIMVRLRAKELNTLLEGNYDYIRGTNT